MWRERFLANQGRLRQSPTFVTPCANVRSSDGPGAGDAPAKSVEEKKPRPAPKEDGVEAKPKQMKPKVEVKPEATKPADAKVKVEASKAKAPEIKAEGKAGSAPPRPAGAPAKPAAGAKPPVPAAKPAPAAPAKASNFDVFRDLLDPMEYKTKVKKQDAAQQASARAKELQEDLDVVEEVRPETHDAGVPPDYAEDMMLPPIEGDGDDMHAPYLEDYMELEYPGKRPGAEDAGPDGPTVKRARTDSSFGIPGFSAVPVRGILKKVPKRSGKKVRWASEDALRMVRVFVPDESEINHERRYRNARDMDVSEGRQAMDSIRNLMQPALKEWPGHLQRLVLPAWDPAMVAVPGAESTEREVQERRDRTVLELSFDVGPPPDNPKEPDPGAPTAEVIPKEIRLDPIGAPPFELPALASSATYSLPVPGGTFQPVALGGSDAMSWDGRPPTWSPPQEQGFPAQALSASNLSSLAALLQQSQGQYAAQPAQQNTYGGFGSTGHGPPPQQSHSYPGYPAHSQSTMVGQSFSGQQSPPYQGSGAQQYGTYGQGQNFEAAQLLENVSRVMQTLPGFAQAAQPSMHPVSSFSQASYPQTSTSYPSQSTGSYPQTSAAPYGADNQAWNTQGQSSFHGDTGSGRGRGGFRGGGRQGILPGGGYENPKPCKFFEKGRCRNGQKCWNLHCDQRGQIVEVTDGSLRLAQRSGT
ncbi:hypothetical protein DFJ74DRAFT_373388 [Hyaloraphidium curvatum]|nr:hypothetical protein DFJ74DRAFT_373388 [Hyaloraphidium curvatum]